MNEPVCSPALAKKLKKYGAPTDSDYCWVKGVLKKRDSTMKRAVPAYTDEEIFNIFPDYILYPGTRYKAELEETPTHKWRIYFSDGTYILNNHIITALTSVDAQAEMIIYLIEQDLFGYN